VTKARLISLMIFAILVAQLAAFCIRPGGFSDGGFW
jgi:hypothetical protein